MPAHLPILLVSDGSVQNRQLTFGWVVGTGCRTILACHADHGHSAPTSHQAEAWGLLSGVLFLHHLLLYTSAGQTPEVQANAFCALTDNQGLVQRVSHRLGYETPYPNSTLAPDWDLVEQIHNIFSRLPFGQKAVTWVKGHQDTTDELPLTVEAEYNVIADSLAGACHAVRPPARALLPVLPAAKCQLWLATSLITSHYTTAIRTTYTTPALFQYLQNRHSWTPTQCQSIDWEVFQRAVSKASLSPIQVLKLVQDRLPTNREVNKSNPLHSQQCHYCNEQETFHHLITCHNSMSSDFRNELLQNVREYIERRHIPLPIGTSFLECLTLAISPQSHIPTDFTSSQSKCCLSAQQALGIHLFLRGFWIQTWRQLHEQDIMKYSTERPSDSVDTFAGLLVIIWKAQLAMWQSHQTTIHQEKTSHKEGQLASTDYYQTKIRHLHHQQGQCLPGHRDLYFHSDVEGFLQTATRTQLRQYLHHYEPVINASLKAAKVQPQRSLFTFPGFHRIRSLQTQNPLCHITSTLATLPRTQSSVARGAPSNRKHTRWRTPQAIGTSIREFFLPKPS